MKNLFPSYVRVPALFFGVFIGMESLIETTSGKPAFIEHPMVAIFLLVFLFLLITIEITLKAINNVTSLLLSEEQRKAKEIEDNKSFFESNFYKKIIEKLTASKSIEEEGEVMLTHDYDGIKELDNKLPPWWVYLFYITIIFAFVYLIRFHVLGHDDQKTEFEKEMEEARLAIEEYKKTAKDLVDYTTVTVLADATDLSAGKKIYEANCAACHRNDGGGGIGPNLTDEHWILGGGISNVFKTISEGGRDGKGMVAWKASLKPSEIQQVASYVLSLQGTNPQEAKVSEGEVWVEQ
jgi:cytochrome c oxidase cbb3-type subunit III